MNGGNRVAIYCRLSQEDRNKSDPAAESRSIQNQRSLLLDYAKEQGWELAELYSDEDYSGSDRERPAFRRLIADAEQGRFDIILCKSQSRFTRELELVEKYINGAFPEWGIRFVSVADHVDTARKDSKKARQLGGLINEWYLEDLSDSIRAVLRDHQRKGWHIGSFAPFGYEKDPDQPGHLLIDEEAAAIVRQIFDLYDGGMGKSTIAGWLNLRQIPNPAAYKQAKGSRYRSKYGEGNSGLWHYSTVAKLLENPLYIGTLAQHRSEKVSYKSSRVRSLPRQEWLLVEHCHEPIISQEQWRRVQKKLQDRSTPSFSGGKGLYAGKLRCLYCGRSLRRCKSNGGKCYFRCSGAQIHSGCVGAFIPLKELNESFWGAFQEQLDSIDSTQLLANWQTMEHSPDSAKLQKKLRENLNAQKALYTDYLRGKISEDWFEELSAAFRQEQEKLENQLTPSPLPLMPTEPDSELLRIFVDYIQVGRRDPSTKKVPIVIHWRF